MNTRVSILSLTACELRKISSQRKYKVLFGIIVLLVIGGAAVSLIPGNPLRLSMANYPYTVLTWLNTLFLPLAVFMLASDLLSGEIGSQEIKVMLTRPVARHKVLIAKYAAIAAYAGVLMAACFVISGIFSVVVAGLASFSILTAVSAYLVGLLPVVALIAMAGMISAAAKSGTATFGLCLLAYVGLSLLGWIFAGAAPALFTSYMGISNMVIGSVIPVSSLLMGVIILFGYTVAFLSLGAISFERKDF